jgi:hypothetical protein
MHFFPWLSVSMLAYEANEVITLRLIKLSQGGDAGFEEASLMIREKIFAGLEAVRTLTEGGTTDSVIEDYRTHVASNAIRLRS